MPPSQTPGASSFSELFERGFSAGATAAAWASLFGAAIGGWLSRFRANPETLEAWCQRELWSK